MMIAYEIDKGETWWAMFSRNVDDGTPVESRQLDAGAEHTFDVVMPARVHYYEFSKRQSKGPLPPGRYKVTFTAIFQKHRFATENENFAAGPYKHPHWTGKIVAAPFHLTVNAAN